MTTLDTSISIRFLLLGDSRIGKTSILERYVNRIFQENYLVTIGMDIRIKRLKINNINLDVCISDTAGEERFRSLSKMLYKSADGILIGFALNDHKSLESVNYWIEQIEEKRIKNNKLEMCSVLFGNKCDDKEHIEVNNEEIEKIKSNYTIEYFETSAKENINVQELFEYLIKITIIKKGLLKHFNLQENTSIDDIIIVEREKEDEITKNDNKNRKNTKKKKLFC